MQTQTHDTLLAELLLEELSRRADASRDLTLVAGHAKKPRPHSAVRAGRAHQLGDRLARL